jgi:hypothetical protein
MSTRQMTSVVDWDCVNLLTSAWHLGARLCVQSLSLPLGFTFSPCWFQASGNFTIVLINIPQTVSSLKARQLTIRADWDIAFLTRSPQKSSGISTFHCSECLSNSRKRIKESKNLGNKFPAFSFGFEICWGRSPERNPSILGYWQKICLGPETFQCSGGSVVYERDSGRGELRRTVD